MNHALLIAIIAALLYAGIVTHPHVLDDQVLISNQPDVRDPTDLRTIFLGRYWGALHPEDKLYRPLTIWTISLNYRLNEILGLPGTHPAQYRITSILLHASASVLLYTFAMRIGLTPFAGYVAALLFAAHPIHTEAVVAAVNRSELLSLCFGLGFLMLHHARRHIWAGALCLLMALFSKESALMFLPLALWLDITHKRLYLPRFGAYLGVCALWFSLRHLSVSDIQMYIHPLDNPLVAAPLTHRLFTALAVQFEYLRLQILPIGLSSDYSYNQIPVLSSFFDWRILLLIAILIAGASLAWRMRATHPLLPFAAGGYAILFAATANVFFPIGTIMGERLAYAPSACFCLLVGYGLTHLPQKRALTLAWPLILILSALTLARNQVWASPDVFYRAQVHSAPNSAKAHSALAKNVFHAPSNNLDSAIVHYRRAVAILPDYYLAWNNLGLALQNTDDADGAMHAFERVLRWQENHTQARYNLGLLYQEQGDTARAIAAYETVISYDDTHLAAHNNLAVLYAQQGRISEARTLVERVLVLDPDYQPAHINLQNLRELETP